MIKLKVSVQKAYTWSMSYNPIYSTHCLELDTSFWIVTASFSDLAGDSGSFPPLEESAAGSSLF